MAECELTKFAPKFDLELTVLILYVLSYIFICLFTFFLSHKGMKKIKDYDAFVIIVQI